MTQSTQSVPVSSTPVAELRLAKAALERFDAAQPTARAKLVARVAAAQSAYDVAMVPVRELALAEALATEHLESMVKVVGLSQAAVRELRAEFAPKTGAAVVEQPKPEPIIATPTIVVQPVTAASIDADVAKPAPVLTMSSAAQTIPAPKAGPKTCSKCGGVGATCSCAKAKPPMSQLTMVIRLTNAVDVKMDNMPDTLDEVDKVVAKCKAKLVKLGGATGGAKALRLVATKLGLSYGNCQVAEHIDRIMSAVEADVKTWVASKLAG